MHKLPQRVLAAYLQAYVVLVSGAVFMSFGTSPSQGASFSDVQLKQVLLKSRTDDTAAN